MKILNLQIMILLTSEKTFKDLMNQLSGVSAGKPYNIAIMKNYYIDKKKELEYQHTDKNATDHTTPKQFYYYYTAIKLMKKLYDPKKDSYTRDNHKNTIDEIWKKYKELQDKWGHAYYKFLEYKTYLI